MSTSSHAFGESAEALAEQTLREKGYRILEKNLRIAGGELDLIAEDHGIVVFVEVKARRGTQFGGASYALTPRKQRQIIKLALCYLSQRGLTNTECRFDAILVTESDEGLLELTHIEQAFEVSSSDWQW